MWHLSKTLLLGVALMGSGWSCSRDAEVREQQAAKDAGEHDLVTDPSAGAGEIGHRLRRAIALSDQTLQLSVDGQTVFVAAMRPWAVICGYGGLRISFGSDDAEVTISVVSYSTTECDKLGPVVIGQLRAIMGSKWIVAPRN